MYQLTLTIAERRAIDWVGNRYAHGTDLYKLLWASGCEAFPNDADWDNTSDITFYVPEHVAWQINEIGEECNYLWDCFAASLGAKLCEFCCKVV